MFFCHKSLWFPQMISTGVYHNTSCHITKLEYGNPHSSLTPTEEKQKLFGSSILLQKSM